MTWVDVGDLKDFSSHNRIVVESSEGDIVVWRAADGSWNACEARCPHQWAHLGFTGVVDGNELVCLSHFWRFDATGAGVKESANGRRDVKTPVEVFPLKVENGRLFLKTDRGVVQILAMP